MTARVPTNGAFEKNSLASSLLDLSGWLHGDWGPSRRYTSVDFVQFTNVTIHLVAIKTSELKRSADGCPSRQTRYLSAGPARRVQVVRETRLSRDQRGLPRPLQSPLHNGRWSTSTKDQQCIDFRIKSYFWWCYCSSISSHLDLVLIVKYMKSLNYLQSHLFSNVRLLLGYTAVIACAAAAYYEYKVGFKNAKPICMLAVGSYFILNTALYLWGHYIEQDIVYIGTKGDITVFPHLLDKFWWAGWDINVNEEVWSYVQSCVQSI